MNATPPNTEALDELDRLFSDFFKAQLTKPWPKAPMPAATTEPSELVTARTTEAPRNQPTPVRATGRDNTARARFTLAASVALMIGTCWYFSNGFAPGERPTAPTPNPNGSFLPGSGAHGGDALDQINKNKATEPKPEPPKVDMSKL
ncbi:MAG: hypothetical protein L0241_12855 [Planctomycetia bacterium]|nr:hypothetical protein [Planctomycetia bacterium]